MALTRGRVEQLRRNAGRLKKRATKWSFSHGDALELVALAEGFESWRELEASAEPRAKTRRPTGQPEDTTGHMPSSAEEAPKWPADLHKAASRSGSDDFSQVEALTAEMRGRRQRTPRETNANRVMASRNDTLGHLALSSATLACMLNHIPTKMSELYLCPAAGGTRTTRHRRLKERFGER
ncbi:hypothetical protein G8A07_06960 [Roseateles sp. DAIF2]|uniref:glyoxalase superfamily protein n=1 Tax=Roseateles sp. DAIF2 TaxID=2714952 RepID=UPI0018A2B313|nr:hypothetical protein [Roseateles sp. DAIF2]QPF72693.1 hypothetical protein G8A07_06960 [Roseateles sp. DAIF2]